MHAVAAHVPLCFISSHAQPKTLREIRRDMHKQREWRNELERMKISNVVGEGFCYKCTSLWCVRQEGTCKDASGRP